MNRGLLELLRPSGGAANRITGVVVGIVTNNNDPEGLGRVKVRFPWLSDENESYWARIAAPMAGEDRGAYFLPEVDDEVLVAFGHGDPRFPYVLGGLWNPQHNPPEHEPLGSDGKVVKRVIKSRSGHVICLDDSEGAEKIEITDRTGNNKIIIRTSDNSIQIAADGDISIQSSRGKLTLRGVGVEIVSQAEVKVEATQNMDMKATARMNIRGATVDIN